MAQENKKDERRPQIEDWEIEVARSVARSFRSFREWEDLEAELFRRLIELKSRTVKSRCWRGFLARSLYNAAKDIIRSWQVREEKAFRPIPGADEDENPSLEELLGGAEDSTEDQLALAALWGELSPELRALWKVLLEEEGNVGRAAKRLGKHRNTVAAWIGRLQAALARHQLNPGSRRTIVQKRDLKRR